MKYHLLKASTLLMPLKLFSRVSKWISDDIFNGSNLWNYSATPSLDLVTKKIDPKLDQIRAEMGPKWGRKYFNPKIQEL